METPSLIILVMIATVPAVITDIRINKIPNIYCLGNIGMALLWHLQTQSVLSATSTVVLGTLAAGLFFLPMYILKAMAAGDVKLMASLGAILGATAGIKAAAMSIIVGAALAIVVYLLRGGGLEMFQRYGRILQLMLVTGRGHFEPAAEGSAARSSFAFAPAILLGTLLSLFWW